jgi:alpha-glucosidase
MKKYLFVLLVLAGASAFGQKKPLSVASPDGKLQVVVNVGSEITYSITHKGDIAIVPSKISMELGDGTVWGRDAKVIRQSVQRVSNTIASPLYKKASVADEYNVLSIAFKGGFALELRAYNDGAAYRFISQLDKDLVVKNEQATFNFKEDYLSYVPYVNARSNDHQENYENQFFNSFENTYTKGKLSELDPKRLMFSPLLVEIANGKKVCIAEADLESYPGMYLTNANGAKALTSVFATYPKTAVQGGHNMLQMVVKERESYIAKVAGKRTFPWRIVLVSENDAQLANSDMVYRLASPSRVKDISWIKPGKVAWDWWNNWGVYNVDFKAGVNTATYKHYIDFASKHGVEYVILDEGWSVNLAVDLMQVVPEINLKEIVDYATAKGVGIILWAGYKAFDKDMEHVCKHYAEMGVKGFKVDFMDRDDQQIVEFSYKAAAMCAKYQLVLDLHGAYKPTGLQRTYPNVLNNEGVHGLEQMKWSAASVDQVTYDVTIPFTRMVAGPMDYTQGAMRNAAMGCYYPCNSEPMSQGTRCRQLGLYVILESPLNMMCDSPDSYEKEAECANFIAQIPTTWDETVALEGKVGEYIAIARRKGDKWYVGALTNWSQRTLAIDLSVLSKGAHRVEIFRDGANADKIGKDYKREVLNLSAEEPLTVTMAPGGGFAAVVSAK